MRAGGGARLLPTLGGADTPDHTRGRPARRLAFPRPGRGRCQHDGVPDLSRMRNDYDAGRLREEDLAPDLGRAVRPLVRRRRRRRAARAERRRPGHGGRRRGPGRARRPDEGLRRGRLHLRHQLRLDEGRAARGQPAGGAGLPVARDAAPGAGRPAGSSGSATRPPTALWDPRPRGRSSPRSRRCSRRSSTPARSSPSGSGCSTSRRRPGRCRGRRSGAATGSSRSRSSSGRAATTGCTTGCGSCATMRRAVAGSCSASPRDAIRSIRSRAASTRPSRRREAEDPAAAAWRSTPPRCATRTTGGCSGASPPRCSASR